MGTPTIDKINLTLPGIATRDEVARRNGNVAGTTRLLEECRDLMLGRIAAALASTLDEIEAEFSALAEKSHDGAERLKWHKTIAEFRDERGNIEATFKSQFFAEFNATLSSGLNAQGKSFDNSSPITLSLVEDRELEQQLTVNEITRLFANASGTESAPLLDRICFLLREPGLSDGAIPLSPRAIVNALVAACEELADGETSKIDVLHGIAKRLASHLPVAYRELNQHLVQRGVRLNSQPVYRQSKHASIQKPTHVESRQFDLPCSIKSNVKPDSKTVAATNIADTLRQLLAGGQLFNPANSAGSAAPPVYGITTGSFAPSPPTSRTREAGDAVAEELRRIVDGKPGTIETELVSALTQMQQGDDSRLSGESSSIERAHCYPVGVQGAPMNVLRDFKTPEILRSASAIDVMTIDIVAMLFDYIFDDNAIPDGIKGLIARLQIPALKVALLDRSFFSLKAHPARRLLDALANSAICFAGEVRPNDPLHAKIAALVARVRAEFETDIQIFAEALADFEKFMAERESANAEIVEQSARIVHERETREMARLVALDEIEKRVAHSVLPAPVAALLKGPWARVLERLYLREGGRRAGFAQALETIDELIWSVAPKNNAEERRRLVVTLPSLLKGIQYGMAIAAVDTPDRTAFFSALVDCHASAVKAGLRGDGAPAKFHEASSAKAKPFFKNLIAEDTARETRRNSRAQSGLVRIKFSDTGVEIEDVAVTACPSAEGVKPNVMSTVGASGASINRCDANRLDPASVAAPVLRRGTWVEFVRCGHQFARAKLSWISPQNGVYLFTNPAATEALSIAPEALQAQIESGDARLIDESSMIDRAVDKLVHSLAQEVRA